MPGAHLETSDHDQGRNEHQGDHLERISHKPGTSEPGRNLETSDHDQGQNEHQGEHLEASAISQERASQGATWRHQP